MTSSPGSLSGNPLTLSDGFCPSVVLVIVVVVLFGASVSVVVVSSDAAILVEKPLLANNAETAIMLIATPATAPIATPFLVPIRNYLPEKLSFSFFVGREAYRQGSKEL